MRRYRSLLLAVVCVTGCNSQAEGENGPVGSESRERAATAPASSAYKAGQTLRVLREAASCRETGPSAGEPWKMKKGAFVNFVAAEGPELRVETAPGMECVIVPEAVGPA